MINTYNNNIYHSNAPSLILVESLVVGDVKSITSISSPSSKSSLLSICVLKVFGRHISTIHKYYILYYMREIKAIYYNT